jgi:hypothetical protein
MFLLPTWRHDPVSGLDADLVAWNPWPASAEGVADLLPVETQRHSITT